MAYSETVASRVRTMFEGNPAVAERKMFGGLAFLINGNMAIGVIDDRLILRLGEEGASAAIQKPHAKLFDFTGKPMKTMVYISPEGFASESDLKQWMQTAITFALSLPPK